MTISVRAYWPTTRLLRRKTRLSEKLSKQNHVIKVDAAPAFGLARGRPFGEASALLLIAVGAAHAQDLGTLHPKVLPPLADPTDPSIAAKQLFARRTTPSPGRPEAIGFYARGCMQGAQSLPMTGDAWQVMRPSRNRNWGLPVLLSFIERTAEKARAADVWPGLLIGDIAQPRGGPMINGHASHQIGLDADIWLRPMPDRLLTREERETMMSTMVVRRDRLDVDPKKWTPAHLALLRLFAEQPEVQRMFVNPAIKKAICRDATGDRSWLSKIRPEYGHDYHFHVRLACPAGQSFCANQIPPPIGDGCNQTLAWWFRPQVLHPTPPRHPQPPPKPLTLAQLPAACRDVLDAQ